jgi:hypothetical protein
MTCNKSQSFLPPTASCQQLAVHHPSSQAAALPPAPRLQPASRCEPPTARGPSPSPLPAPTPHTLPAGTQPAQQGRPSPPAAGRPSLQPLRCSSRCATPTAAAAPTAPTWKAGCSGWLQPAATRPATRPRPSRPLGQQPPATARLHQARRQQQRAGSSSAAAAAMAAGAACCGPPAQWPGLAWRHLHISSGLPPFQRSRPALQPPPSPQPQRPPWPAQRRRSSATRGPTPPPPRPPCTRCPSHPAGQATHLTSPAPTSWSCLWW